jgi:hypothetical protein
MMFIHEGQRGQDLHLQGVQEDQGQLPGIRAVPGPLAPRQIAPGQLAPGQLAPRQLAP